MAYCLFQYIIVEHDKIFQCKYKIDYNFPIVKYCLYHITINDVTSP